LIILQVRFIEVDQESDPAVGEPQVGLQLFLEYGCRPIDRLDVDHHPAVHQQIQHEGILEAQPSAL
jgi:hypothetical protein